MQWIGDPTNGARNSEAKKDPITIGNHENLQNLENLVVVICGDFAGGGGGGGCLVFKVGYGVLFYGFLLISELFLFFES